MAGFEAMQLLVLLATVAVVATAGGFVGSALARRHTRTARGSFLVGFCCGMTASTYRRGRRRILRRVHAIRHLGADPSHRIARRA